MALGIRQMLRGIDGPLAMRAARFIIVGSSNTLLTGVLFVVLSVAISQPDAYALSFAAGVAFSVCMTSRFVFGRNLQVRLLAIYGAWYVCAFAAGDVIVRLMAHQHRPAILTSLALVAVISPLSFCVGHFVFRPLRGRA